MKLYIASSWKNFLILRPFAKHLRGFGHDVYLFCDETEPACKSSLLLRSGDEHRTWTAETVFNDDRLDAVYAPNMAKLEWSEAVLLFLPCGKSAHMEAGWEKGAGKYLIIFGDTEPGDWDAMYRMADKYFPIASTSEMFRYFEELGKAEAGEIEATHGQTDIQREGGTP